MNIRWMIRRDMPEVLSIERRAFPDPWSEEEFCLALVQRNVIGLVAEQDEQVVGYVIYELHRERLEIFNLAVDPQRRREGIGRELVARLQKKLSFERRRWLWVKVVDWNLPGQLFFQSCGFRATGVLAGYYDCGADAYELVYDCMQRATRSEPSA